MNCPKETINLSWSMDDESWSHWVQGLGKKTVCDAFLEGLHAIRKSSEVRKNIRIWCQHRREYPEPIGSDTEAAGRPRRKIEIQVPADHWNEACQRIGRIDCEPIRTGELLAAMIVESESWKQCGDAAGEFGSGWHLEEVISSTASAELAHSQRFSLETQERVIAWIVAAAAIAGAAAAWVAWLYPSS